MRACQMRSKGSGKYAAASRTKSSYNSRECFNIINRLEHETFDYVERLQGRSDREFTEDELFMLVTEHIHDSLSDDQLFDLYKYFGHYVGTKTVLNDEQKAQVLDTVAYMVMDHFDDLN